MNTNLKVVVCAAGQGKRISDITTNCPKPMIKVGRKSILEYMLDNFSAFGLKEIIIIVGYQAEHIVNSIGEKYKNCQITYIYNKDFESTNNIYSLWLAKKEITNGMIFFNADIILNRGIIKKVLSSVHQESIVVDFDHIIEDSVKAVYEGDNLIRIGKEVTGKKIGWAIGIYKLSQLASEKYFEISERLFEIEKNKNVSFVVPFEKMIKTFSIKAVPVDNLPWVEIDTLEDYKYALKKIDSILK